MAENEFMQVQMLRSMADRNGSAGIGAIVNLPIAQARDLVEHGYAIAFDPQAAKVDPVALDATLSRRFRRLF